MSTKKIQISPDGGTTWHTFPGDTGDLTTTATDIKDTVFGQIYESGQTGLAEWTLSCNGYYKGFAGYVATIKKAGSTTAMTNEPSSQIGATKSYQITNSAHQVIDRTVTLHVFDNGVDQTANVVTIDYLFGIVTFATGYSPVGPVTITGNYWPMAQVAKGQTFTLTQSATTIDTTDFATAQGNGGMKTVSPGLNTVTLELGGVFAISNGWKAAILARSEIMVEITPDGSELATCRGIFKPLSDAQSGKVGELEVETVKLTLSVPDPSTYPLLAYPFSWKFAANTTLSAAIQNALQAWTGQLSYNYNYLEDGTNGQTGVGVLTDVSLKGGLDVMNEFSIKVSGSGALTAVGTG